MGWDWDAVMREEGQILDSFISKEMSFSGPYALLDCSCGIGTQAIGLALQGHRVYATDLSRVSIECAQQQATNQNVAMNFGIADFRCLGEALSETFDVVLTCDNSIAHCLKDADLKAALSSMRERLNPGGLLLISLRDYDALVVNKPRFNNEHVDERPDGRRVVFQLWDWADDGHSYSNNQFLLKENDGAYEVKHFQTQLRALLRHEIMSAVEAAGLTDVSWHHSENSGYYQPIVTARKP